MGTRAATSRRPSPPSSVAAGGTPLADDPVALRSPAMCRFFAGVMDRQMHRSFRAVRVMRPGPPDIPPDAPLVVYSSHPSWWDPAFFIVLTTRLFQTRESYGPMEAEALERYRFMQRIGLFGVDPGTRAGAVRFLKVGERVLSDPARMIWMTAQGRFADPRERPLELRPGLAHLLARVPGAVALPLAVEYPFWAEKRPEALAAFGEPVRHDGSTDATHEALTDALAGAMDRLADASVARDPARFGTVLGGVRGVGGIYGLWSRARAAVKGSPYDPDHMAETGEGRR